MTRQKPVEGHWSFDKKIPVAIIAAILIQTAGIVWWAGGASERLTSLERKAEITAPYAERLARVETNLESVRDGVLEIKSILRKESPPVVPRPRQ